MKRLPCLALALCIAAEPTAAQEQLAYDVPRGWTSTQDPQSGLVTLAPPGLQPPQVGVISVYRPEAFAGTAQDFHRLIVSRSTTNARVLESMPPATVGALQVTNIHQQMPDGVQFWTRIYTGRWADRGQAIILITNAPDLLARFTPAADSMMSRIVVPQAVAAPPAPAQPQSAPAAAPTNTGAPVAALPGSSTFGDYAYVAPAGWTSQPSGNGLWIVSPPGPSGERCTIGLWPMAPASGDLSADAQRAWAQVFSGLAIRPDDPLNRTLLVRGLAPQGWEYVVLRRPIVSPNDRESSLGGTVMVAKLGDRDAIVSFFSGDPRHSVCYQYGYSFHPEVWPRFFASLRFRNWTGPAATALAQRVQGGWQSIGTSTGGGAVLQYAFTPSGRYAFFGVGQRYMVLSHFDAVVWTSPTFGDGSYVIRGNELTLRPDHGGAPDPFLFRLEQVSEDGGRTWTEKLFLMQPTRVTTIDGTTLHDNEIALERRNP